MLRKKKNKYTHKKTRKNKTIGRPRLSKIVKVISLCNINKFICILYFIVSLKYPQSWYMHWRTDSTWTRERGGGTNIFIKFLLYIMLCMFFFSVYTLPSPLRPLYMSTHMQPQPLLPALRNDVVTRFHLGFPCPRKPFLSRFQCGFYTESGYITCEFSKKENQDII